jgi:tetraacyldisaccharide 4'-kinase
VITRCQQLPHPTLYEEHARWGKKTPIFQSRHRADCLVKVDSEGKEKDLSFLQGKRIAAFCGLAQPNSFRDLIAQLGGKVVDFQSFRDHQRYGKRKLQQIVNLFRSSEAEMILTSEKDEVKLPGELFPPELPLWSLRIRLELKEGKKDFEQLIFSAVSDRSNGPD